MQKKKILPTLFFLSLVSAGIIFLSFLGKLSFLENSALSIFSPFQKAILRTFHIDLGKDSEPEELKKENAQLLKKLSDQALLESENKALRDQFEVEYPHSLDLLPAKVIGSPGFVPGVSEPSYLILDRGEKDGIRKGHAVISQTNLIGKITQTRSNVSKVELIQSRSSSFTAKAVSYEDGREVAGIIKGEGMDMVLGNVLLPETLKVGDVVLTKGDVDEKGAGFLPNLIVGKITSVEKKSSDFFQKAQVKSPVDFSKVSEVFVILR